MLYDALGSELIYGNLRKLGFMIHENYLCFLEIIYQHLQVMDYAKVLKETIGTILQNKKGVILESSLVLKNMLENNNSIMKLVSKLIKLKSTNQSSTYMKTQKGKNQINIKTTLSTVHKSIEDNTADLLNMRTILQNVVKNSPQINAGKGVLSLPVLKGPFLPPLKDDEKNNTYTLVLDLDETLVHMQSIGIQGKLLIRPGAREFLEQLSEYFEIVIYTAALSDVTLFA